MAILDFMGSMAREQTAYLLLGALLVSFAALAVQRLWLSPIAHIPGPKLAALTQLYEFYYDFILDGQYTLKIIELHEQYGPVVRINPWEVHVKAHEFRPELYSGLSRSSDKSIFLTKHFGAPHNALATINHDQKLRRAALDPIFSIQSVRNLEPMIEEKANKLVRAFARHAALGDGRPLNVMYPFSAYSNDLINEYAFSRCDDLIERSDFGAEVTDSMLTGTHTGNPVKHAGLTLPIVNRLPGSLSARWVTSWAGISKMKKDLVDQISDIKATKDTEKWQLDISHPTIFHELLSTKTLPAEKKTLVRLAQEGQILVQGGTLTVSWTLSIATFHLLHQPSTLQTLRDELFGAIPDPDEAVSLAKLEKLPYLRAVVKESLRLAIGTTGRLARVPADEALACLDPESGEEMRVRPGTVVSTSPYLTIMDDSIFPDPKGFHPERWLAEGAEGLDKYLVVFGGGSRHCPGQFLANAELYLVLAKLFRRWGGAGVVGGSDEGDRRPGDVGVFRIFETTPADCEVASEYSTPIPFKGSKGLRFVLEAC